MVRSCQDLVPTARRAGLFTGDSHADIIARDAARIPALAIPLRHLQDPTPPQHIDNQLAFVRVFKSTH
jgi:hypothetical protein